jgi:endonuclease III
MTVCDEVKSGLQLSFSKDPSVHLWDFLTTSTQNLDSAPAPSTRTMRLSISSGSSLSSARTSITDPFSPASSSPPGSPASFFSELALPFQYQPTPRPTPSKRRPTKSHYFTTPKETKQPTSCLPFPPLSAESFGLVQETLASHPFRLLLATIFLNRTRGSEALPVFYKFLSLYPTPSALASAEQSDIVSLIHGLGFQNQRAGKCIALAKMWIDRPPEKGKRYRKRDYPLKGDGADIVADEVVDEADTRVAWEIAHLPGCGPYALDSWRIFCRDEVRGLADNWKGTGCGDRNGLGIEDDEAVDLELFEPEWKRVLPMDKELRAYLTWMWLKEGWVWDPGSGERTRASREAMERAERGGVGVEGEKGWVVNGEGGEAVSGVVVEDRVAGGGGEMVLGEE